MAKKDAVVLESGEKIESIGPWTIAWRKFRQNRVAMAGLIIFILIVIAVIVIPPMLGYSVNDYDLSNPNLGGRISIMVGIIAAVITVILGCTIGGISGYYGGKLDNVLMRFAEIVYSLPFTPMIIAVASTMLWVPQSQKMYTVSLLIGLLSWPGLARLVRGQILTLREQEFMQACEALGISDFSKIFKHLLPNVISLVIVNATLQMASAILTEAGLSFLGMGVTAPTPSWGNLMNLARDSYVFQNYPWEWIPAGLMCLLTVISINLIGEGLRDAFDPKELQ